MSTAGTRTDLGTGDIRVLLIPGSYHFDNVGDVAMCQVAAERIRAVHPGAHMRVLASSDELLEANGLTQATAFHEAPWMIWGKPVSLWLRRERDARRRSLPFRRPRRFLAQAALTRKVSDYAAARGFVQEVLAADLMVICGQGGLHDGSARRAGRLAGMVRLASAAGIPVVASSQGIGPLEDDDLRQVVAEALGEARAVGLREEGSAPVMTAMGIPADRWAVTGDDAIAAALAHAGGEPEDRIGVSLRDNRAASIPSDLPAVVGRAIVAARPGVPVELVAMMEEPPISDTAFLAGVRPEGSELTAHRAEPAHALAALARCRVVVTGTYHAAVFSQSMGIPVVCLAATPYYQQKMRGVLGQFGDIGGEVLDPFAPGFAEDLSAAIERWWDAPDTLAPQLRATAAAQAEVARSFFEGHIAEVRPRS